MSAVRKGNSSSDRKEQSEKICQLRQWNFSKCEDWSKRGRAFPIISVNETDSG